MDCSAIWVKRSLNDRYILPIEYVVVCVGSLLGFKYKTKLLFHLLNIRLCNKFFINARRLPRLTAETNWQIGYYKSCYVFISSSWDHPVIIYSVQTLCLEIYNSTSSIHRNYLIDLLSAITRKRSKTEHPRNLNNFCNVIHRTGLTFSINVNCFVYFIYETSTMTLRPFLFAGIIYFQHYRMHWKAYGNLTINLVVNELLKWNYSWASFLNTCFASFRSVRTNYNHYHFYPLCLLPSIKVTRILRNQRDKRHKWYIIKDD